MLFVDKSFLNMLLLMVRYDSFFKPLIRYSRVILAVLSGHNLSCIKRDRTLFENIKFSIDKGQLLHVKGANGAGKTSLLRILVGLSQPDSGQVLFENHCIFAHPADFHSSLVYFGHKLGLNPSLSAIENLRFWCELNQIEFHIDNIYKVLEKVGLVGLEALPVGNLSAGQQRRVSLTRIWLKSTSCLWVLDEPFTALDVDGIELLKNKIVEHLTNHGSVVMTSHQRLDLSWKVKELHLEYQI
jgi:heme exporter protein A